MKADLLKISFTGDIMCLKEQNSALTNTYGELLYSETFRYSTKLFAGSDYVVGNLETPISRHQLSKEDICFNTPPIFLQALKDCGFNFLSTANNHCLDRGLDGLNQTLEYLDMHNLDHSGTYNNFSESNELFIKNIKNCRIAIICCTFGTNSERNGEILPDEECWRVDLLKKQNKKSLAVNKKMGSQIISRMIPDNVSIAAIKNKANDKYINRIKHKIQKARQSADIVIVIPHIGGQYNPAPGIYTKYTINWLTRMKPSLIVAGHPHVPLRFEDINGVFTAYSLGNFSFNPGVGYYIPNVFSEYGIVLHTYWDQYNFTMMKKTFSIVKNVIGEDGIARVYPLFDLYNSTQSMIEKECLAIDNEAIVNRLTGNHTSVDMRFEYILP